MTTLEELPTGLDEADRAALFADAHTVQHFASTPVSDAQLAEIWDLTRWAPTAANLQPLRVLFVRSGEGRDRLLPLLADTNRDRAATAPVTAVLATDDRFHDTITTVAPYMAQMQPMLEENSALRGEMGGYSAALQAGYFILAIRALGLSAGPMAGFDKDGVDAAFFAGTSWRSHLVVNIGYPADEDAFRPRMPRLSPEDVVRFA